LLLNDLRRQLRCPLQRVLLNDAPLPGADTEIPQYPGFIPDEPPFASSPNRIAMPAIAPGPLTNIIIRKDCGEAQFSLQ
jgi:hypothetical protein